MSVDKVKNIIAFITESCDGDQEILFKEFLEHDTSMDGQLSADETKALIDGFCMGVSEEDKAKYVEDLKKYDTDGSGTVGLFEFFQWWAGATKTAGAGLHTILAAKKVAGKGMGMFKMFTTPAWEERLKEKPDLAGPAESGYSAEAYRILKLKQSGEVEEVKTMLKEGKGRKLDDEHALKFEICFNSVAKDGQLAVENFSELAMVLGLDVKASQYIAVKEVHEQPTMDKDTFISFYTRLEGGLHLGDALGNVTGAIGGLFSGFGGGGDEKKEEKKEEEGEKKAEENGEAPAAAAEGDAAPAAEAAAEAPAAEGDAAPAE